jgi:hypothetical protein
MSRNETVYLITTPKGETLYAKFKWTVSRGRDTYGYNICTLYIDGKRVARCNGGGYDMQGTCLGSWLACHAKDRLLKLKQEFYGLTFQDPDFDPGKAVVGEGCDDRTFDERGKGKTVEQAEQDGDSVGLERYQAVYRASSKLPSERHTIPHIDGACGFSCVERIGNAVGYGFAYKG